ncbi:MAG: WG repeat-containing protein [Saprospiraceae bacterium]
MKYKKLLLALLLILPFLSPAQSQLLRIEEAGKYGYINLNGEVVISPKYVEAFNFSEGLGAVRLTDKFGFIDSTGQWQIPPIYDYAKPFKNGQASVWLEGKEMLVSTTGVPSPKRKYNNRNSVPEGFTILESSDGKFGAADENGRVILDTIHHWVMWKEDGYFILSKDKIIDGADFIEFGIANAQGILKTPFGKYEGIKSIGEGWFYVTKQNLSFYEKKKDRWIPLRNKKNRAFGIVKIEDGKFRQITDSRFEAINGNYHDGSISVRLRDTSIFKYGYLGFIDTTAAVFLADTNFNFVYSFYDGITFVKDRQLRKYFLINKEGKRLHNIGFTKLLPLKSNGYNTQFTQNYFLNDHAIVDTEEGIAKLNVSGDLEIIDVLKGMYFGHFVEQRYLYVIPKTNQPELQCKGIYDLLLDKLLPICVEKIHPEMLGKKLFLVEENQRSAYVDTSGTIVWQQKEPLDIYPYDVTDKIILKERKRKPQLLHWVYHIFTNKPKASFGYRKKTFKEKGKSYHANNLYIMNPSKDTLVIDGGFSGRIPIKLQAKNSKGEWKTINYHGSICVVGTRNNKKTLPPGYYWYYRFPKFEGHIKITFRVVVPYTKKEAPDVPLEMVTEFEGGINPAQFWRIR